MALRQGRGSGRGSGSGCPVPAYQSGSEEIGKLSSKLLAVVDSSMESPDHPGRSPSHPQQLLQQVCGRSSKTAGGPTQQLHIEGLISGLERLDRIGDILRITSAKHFIAE